MKWYDIKLNNVELIGDFPYFKDTEKVEICDMGFGNYKGVGVYKRGEYGVHNGEVFKTKSEAIERAKIHYGSNKKFPDGTIPFEIVFYLKGIGWQVFTANTIRNEHLVRDKMKEKVTA